MTKTQRQGCQQFLDHYGSVGLLAVNHLFNLGRNASKTITDQGIEEACEKRAKENAEIEKTKGSIAIMSPDFEKAILSATRDLAQLELIQVIWIASKLFDMTLSH